MDAYVKAGAKYFFSMGVHHDNYDMWNSKYQPRWNAVACGPKKDIVGLWGRAARRRGLRFGVSDHLSNSFDWFAPSHLCDKKGAYANVAYDGTDPAFADLYHSYAEEPAGFASHVAPMGRVAPERWKQEYFRRIRDLLDQHHPDLLYTDCGIPFGKYGLSLVAEEYNESASIHGAAWNRYTTAKYQRIARWAHACSTGNVELQTIFDRSHGRPIPASATGTTRRASSTSQPRR